MLVLSQKRFYYLTKKSKPPITKGNTEIRIKRLTTLLNTWDRGQCCGHPTYYSRVTGPPCVMTTEVWYESRLKFQSPRHAKVVPNQNTTEATAHSGPAKGNTCLWCMSQ